MNAAFIYTFNANGDTLVLNRIGRAASFADEMTSIEELTNKQIRLTQRTGPQTFRPATKKSDAAVASSVGGNASGKTKKTERKEVMMSSVFTVR